MGARPRGRRTDPIARVIAPPRRRRPAADEPSTIVADTEYVACVVPAFTADGADAGTAARRSRATLRLVDVPHRAAGRLPRSGGEAAQGRPGRDRAAGGKPFGRAEVRYTQRGDSGEDDDPRRPPARCGCRRSGADPIQRTCRRTADIVAGGRGARRCASSRRTVAASSRRRATTHRSRTRTPSAIRRPAAGSHSCAAIRACAAPRGSAPGTRSNGRIGSPMRPPRRPATSAIARDRIRHVALGVEGEPLAVAPAICPPMPSDASPCSRPCWDGCCDRPATSVLDTIAGRTPQLARALFSSAARRALRPGPARTALTAKDARHSAPCSAPPSECPDDREPDPARHSSHGTRSRIARSSGPSIDAAGGDDELAERDPRRTRPQPERGPVAAALRALAPGRSGTPDRDAVEQFLRTRDYREPDRTLLEWPAG